MDFVRPEPFTSLAGDRQLGKYFPDGTRQLGKKSEKCGNFHAKWGKNTERTVMCTEPLIDAAYIQSIETKRNNGMLADPVLSRVWLLTRHAVNAGDIFL